MNKKLKLKMMEEELRIKESILKMTQFNNIHYPRIQASIVEYKNEIAKLRGEDEGI